MKRTVWVLTFLLSVCAFAAGQTAAESKCPTLEVTGPSGVTAPGGIMPFVVLVSEPRLKDLTFTWTVSAGTIVEGQGTRVLKVRAPIKAAGDPVKASVTVGGLPQGCLNTSANGSPVAAAPPICIPQDSYGPLSMDDEKARLVNAAVQLKNSSGAKLTIIKYFPKPGLAA